ncbi:MAG: hypothetical protein A2428_17165 [Bdellovibrionales bacterium RIFOXYC1_FULL_54_43]|nr:MAG: hypothetical protein A2428_17165 [Bdellovibrionales bacterium RIFOXYC1_FULL_54_43]OFZ82060.1 MAG: hypothetical protein A2603_01540 [Bdellovibrionales bacterium RIFOXYD1_FULL_55_31]
MLKDAVRNAKERGASDLLLEAGTSIVLRIRGELIPVGEPIPAHVLLSSAKDFLGPELWQEFLERRSVDLSRTVHGVRCRVNVFQTVRGLGLAIRLLSSFQNNLRDCNLHPDLRRFVEAKTGLVIISGPTGSGKSTTLAALIEEINRTQRRHILAIESPIEYFFTNRQSFIRQREVPTHVPSFEQALIDAMRESPDVLVIGEMRTPDVMRLTLNAAETGHLVLATLHSSTCAEALSRICLSFPSEMQSSIRTQLADCLNGVICQRLTYLPQQQLQIPQCEVLVANTSAKSNIRAGQFSQIVSTIQVGGEDGMWSFDRYARWIEQKKDWVRPSQATPLKENEEAVAAEALLRASGIAPARSAATPSATRGPLKQEPGQKKPAPKPDTAETGRIEIPVSEEDLEDLEELVKKIPEKSGSGER